jgi:hypothetical protein
MMVATARMAQLVSGEATLFATASIGIRCRRQQEAQGDLPF